MSAAGELPVPNKPKLSANSVVKKKNRSRIEEKKRTAGAHQRSVFSHWKGRKETQLIRWVCVVDVVDVGQCIRKRKEREREGQWTHTLFSCRTMCCTAGPAPTEWPATVCALGVQAGGGADWPNLYIEGKPVILCRYHH